jgi:hypothetical protein
MPRVGPLRPDEARDRRDARRAQRFHEPALEDAHRKARAAACRLRLIHDPSVMDALLDAAGDDAELAALFRR